jgi:localization factor PodJL
VPADAGEAVRWYEAAAAQGNRKAMHALGVAYAEGRGTQKDLSTAARWFSKAAQLGFLNSEFNLAVLYERGEGVPQSLTDAYKWYAIAAAQGDAESRARTEALKTQLSAADIAAAERAAVMFRPQNVDPKANTGPVLADLAGAASLAR